MYGTERHFAYIYTHTHLYNISKIYYPSKYRIVHTGYFFGYSPGVYEDFVEENIVLLDRRPFYE